MLEAAENARCVEVADIAIAERNFIKPDILWRANNDAFAGQVCVAVITGDLCILAVIYVSPAKLYLERLYRFRIKIKLLGVDVRLWVAGADAGVVPAGGEAVAGLKLCDHAVLCLTVKFESAATDELP